MEEIFQIDQLIKYIYIHVPFCLKKCNYCSFYSEIYSEDLKKKFISCLIEEIKLFKDKFDIKSGTIYFGGGTPSLLSSEDINNIISEFNLTYIKEITLEANPININKIYAKEGFESRHNLCYWNDEFYLGLGPSAVGYFKNFRYTNPADLEEYFSQIKTYQSGSCRMGSLSNKDHEKEFIFLSLRKTQGLDLKEFQSKFNENFLMKYDKIIDKYLRNKYLEISENYVKLTPKVYFVSNEIFSEFV